MKSEVAIPNGGWGWIIVACSFLIHMFVVGTIYALSVLYVAWLDHFGDSKGLTSWIISLAVAVMFGIGPVPGALSKRFGNRAVVVLGGIIMSIGFAASFFAWNVYYLVVSIGIITGTGAGCCYLPSVSMVAMYFTTKRSIAMGIAASGLGAGAFCMAPFLHWLVNYYGWRGCMLILSGISLNMCVLGALMRPLEKAPKCRNCHAENDGDVLSVDFSVLSKRNLAAGECNAVESCADDIEGECEDLCGERHYTSVSGPCRRPNTNLYHSLPSSDVDALVAPVAYFPVHPAVVHHQESCSHKGNTSTDQDHTKNVSCSCQDKSLSNSNEPDDNSLFHSKENHNINTCDDKIIDLVNPQNKLLLDVKLYDKSQLGGSLGALTSSKMTSCSSSSNRKQYSSEMELRNSQNMAALPLPVTHEAASLNDIQIMLAGSVSSLVYMEQTWKDVSMLSLRSCGNSSVIHKCSTVMEEIEDPIEEKHWSYCSKLMSSLHIYVKLLQNGTFLCFSISNFLTNLSFFMPVLYMVDRAIDSGIEGGEAAMLISLYGAGNMFGKVFFGWLADRELVDRLFYYIASLTVCGLSTSLSPLCGSNQELHSVYAFVFGCFIGSYVTLVPIVTVDLMGLSVVAESFGLLLCFMGVATAFGTPLAGWIFDWTGSYTTSFVLHGIFILLSSSMLIPLLILKKRQKQRTVEQ